ncbi:MAG: gamma-glutamyltransferase, partial [Pseudomonas sp.]|nr:gamma-glutamyltransferase [Pseudomonas sp.]
MRIAMRGVVAALLCLAFATAHGADGRAAAKRPPGAAIASAHALATDAGFEVLRAGGNAFDAAVAVSSVLSV